MSFLKKYGDRMIVISITIILIAIIGLTGSERMQLTSVERIIGNIFSPVEKVFSAASNKVVNGIDSVKNVFRLKEENENLRKKVAELENKNREYENIISKADYLQKEEQLLNNTKYNLVGANIIAKEPGNWFDRFVIDKGLKDGIKKGDTVVQGIEIENNVVQEGLVGRVSDVGDNWAKVISIIDENSDISYKIIRTQDGGILSGSVDGKLSGYLFDSDADIVKGDKLFTSGLGEGFVKDLYVGEVTEVEKDEKNLMKSILVDPAINFKKIYKVYIIINK
ncbi:MULTISPECIES: rod shape-determining protein MreC [Tissierellales]|jgi:rod shape-determining protein MreC|uniref:Cell shape-determining protein MreC n=1 Tax=Acidilutibacter cellobiosedens TaxID=2507161 RepID=A0A410QE07_9FIRM|nr:MULTISPECIES: rod shape-determining protein MreC [Tissierellales]MBE6081256.1 rod shape-determining protein MreC [Tissierellaceae bacterium]QAT62215.1 rod shape-determining protein MreC [Acidilutibacter cellobiosedens]